MTDAAIDPAKAALRREALAARAALNESYRAAAAQRLSTTNVTGLALSESHTVAGYWPIRDELDCRPCWKGCARRSSDRASGGHGQGRAAAVRLWIEGAALMPAGLAPWRLPRVRLRACPIWCCCPCVALTIAAQGLGYGGGYYDRTLAALPRPVRRVGLAFAAQELDTIPRDRHDIPLDAVITEDGVRIFNEAQ